MSDLSPEAQIVLDILQDSSDRMSCVALAALLGVEPKECGGYLRELRRKGLAEKQGNTRGATWSAVPPTPEAPAAKAATRKR